MPSAAFTSCWWALVKSQTPSGMPTNVGASSQPVLRMWIFRQSCTTTTAAMTMESRTASGAATSMGMVSASNGTAISASPKPKVERTRVAKNTTSRTCSVVVSTHLPSSQYW